MAKFIAATPEYVPAKVPFFEDSSDAGVAGYRTRKSPEALQKEIATQLGRLDAGAPRFIAGEFYTTNGKKRYGYRVEFFWGNVGHRIECAALPLRSETKAKKLQALAQALYILRDKLEALANSFIYEPDSMPLVPYMIGAGGRTVTEAMREYQTLALPGPGGVEDTESE